jgi:hypothetical protein
VQPKGSDTFDEAAWSVNSVNVDGTEGNSGYRGFGRVTFTMEQIHKYYVYGVVLETSARVSSESASATSVTVTLTMVSAKLALASSEMASAVVSSAMASVTSAMLL